MKTKKNKFDSHNLPVVFLVISMIVFGFLLFYIVGVLLQIQPHQNIGKMVQPSSEDNQNNIQFAAYFPGCTLLEENCLTKDCSKYFLCNEENYAVCEIYDCRDEFGIGTIDLNGKRENKKELKPDQVEIRKSVDKCQGSFSVLSEKCNDNVLNLKVKTNVSKECKVQGFLFKYYNEETEKSLAESASIISQNEEVFNISIDNCNQYSGIIAVSEDGVSIHEEK